MAMATLNLSIVAKRMLSKAEAAHYCGMAVKRFETDCPVRPVQYPGGNMRWDTRDLDQWLDGLKDNSDKDDTVESVVARLR
jgi:predicted DNA-binding transcriptional regulator AlpA